MASAGIRSHIAHLNYSTIFTTRDVLKYGKRNAVDQCLHFLVKSGEIRRLARGVFVQDPHINPSIEEIAEIKAVAFGKRIYKYATEVLNEIARFPQKDESKEQYGKTFAINGHSSRFETFRGQVKYKGIAQRKAKLCESSIGEKVNALWHLVSDEHIENAVRFVFRNLNRAERLSLRSCSSLMPGWLNDMFIDRFARTFAA